MQTLRAGGGAENFRSAADPVPGGTGRWPKFNQLEMVTTFTWSLMVTTFKQTQSGEEGYM